ncbi:hypothetical protein C8J56DRAFT_1061339 [Mycena floridula]|nr:hypothetical protein C8J56DRAFT_1061339 [Mycena floridula]
MFCLSGIDELPVCWVTAVISSHQLVRALLPGRYEARLSRSSVAHDLAFKSFFNLKPASMVAGK